MNLVKLFRFLILGSFIVAILGLCVDSFVPGVLPAELKDLYDRLTTGDEEGVAGALGFALVGLAILAGGVVGMVGLWQFERWGRPVSLWVTVLALPLYPIMGPVLYSGWQAMLSEVSMMMWGAALAMVYFSELKVRFEE